MTMTTTLTMTLQFPTRMPPAYSLGAGRWETSAPWSFTLDGFATEIPAGFICDLYSVPLPLSVFIPRDEQDNRPALIHDWLYATVGLRADAASPSRFTRAQADETLRLACQRCGIPALRSWSIHTGVRLGGWIPWSALERGGCSLAKPKMD